MSPSLQNALVRQFARPTGPLGPLAGWIMSRRASNRERNTWTVALLEIEPEDRVLEIGYGPGFAVSEVARRLSGGRVVGLDHSDAMWRQARRRNRSAIRDGTVELHRGSSADLATLALGDAFDKAFTVNCMQFWPEPAATLRALRERLVPGGRLAITQQPRKPGATRADVDAAAAAIERQLGETGWEPERREILPLEPVAAVCVLARRPLERLEHDR